MPVLGKATSEVHHWRQVAHEPYEQSSTHNDCGDSSAGAGATGSSLVIGNTISRVLCARSWPACASRRWLLQCCIVPRTPRLLRLLRCADVAPTCDERVPVPAVQAVQYMFR
eukprot:2902260-Prymnesium_polylepis.2